MLEERMPQSLPRVGLRIVLPIVFLAFGLSFCNDSMGDREPKVGARYKIERTLYISAVYDDRKNRKISRETAKAYLFTQLTATKSFHAFKKEVPVGTILTIDSSISKIWHLPFYPSRYIVSLEPDPSQGLDVIMSLNRHFKGNVDGLNPEIFSRY